MTVAERPALPASIHYAGFSSRLAAYLLDWLVMFILSCLVLAAAGLYLLMASDMGRRDPSDRDMVWFIAIASLSAPLWLVLTVGGWAWFGRTVGKLAMNLRIVTSSGGRPGLLRAVVRLVVYTLEGLPLAVALPAGITAWMLREHIAYQAVLAGLGGSLLLPLGSAILLWRDRYHRSLHDLLSGTRVIVDQAGPFPVEEHR